MTREMGVACLPPGAELRNVGPPSGLETGVAQTGLCSPPYPAILPPRPGLTGLGAQSSPAIPEEWGNGPRPAHWALCRSFLAVIWS